jgi:hypothetical protein
MTSGAATWRAWRPRRWTTPTRSRGPAARQVPAGVRPARRLQQHRRERDGGQHLQHPAGAAGRDRQRARCGGGRLLPARRTQVAAGYALYGPTTMLVLTVGNGVAGFTLDPNLGEFMLTHPNLQIPADTQEFAINASNSRFWEPPVKRYVDECLAGKTGPRGKDFNMRWIASMVAEAHRILMRGGVFMYPRDTKDPQTRAPAPAVRGQPDRLHHRAGRRPRQHRPPADAGRAADHRCTSASAWCSARRTRWSASSATTRAGRARSRTRCLPSAACFATECY